LIDVDELINKLETMNEWCDQHNAMQLLSDIEVQTIIEALEEYK